MKAMTEDQQKIFDSETLGLEAVSLNPAADFIESMGFKFARYIQLANYRGDDAELEVYEDGQGKKIVKLCVIQRTYSEGDLFHHSCFAPPDLLPRLASDNAAL
ncbi:MAG: hypothetical protein H6541_06125 [Lentimicrobiaceae bacterium]|nr:hypothetical protein [Lentimicrobiaceae bacterium]MCB9023324.1 hypothetical protein [Lentimicrobiaceae bacterium]MCO5265730.1 hypothetical protein [Lentimicrobium sp.]HPG33829.1 hypothetical protein [Lentimicrobium sp.]